MQKQRPELFSKKRCFYKFREIRRKTPVPETLFDKVAGGRTTAIVDGNVFSVILK